MAENAGSLLVRAGLVGEDELTFARRAARVRGVTVVEHLVLDGVIDDDELAEFLCKALAAPRVDPDDLARIPADVIEFIPADVATEHRVVPISLSGDSLVVAMSDPTDTDAIDEIAFFSDLSVVAAVATQRQIAWSLGHYYGVVTPLGETLLTAATGEPTELPPGAPARGEDSGNDGARSRRQPPPRHRTGDPRVSPHEDTPPRGTPVNGADAPDAPDAPHIAAHREPPPELRPRFGEVVARSETEATPRSSSWRLPAVVVDNSQFDDADTLQRPRGLDHRSGESWAAQRGDDADLGRDDDDSEPVIEPGAGLDADRFDRLADTVPGRPVRSDRRAGSAIPRGRRRSRSRAVDDADTDVDLFMTAAGPAPDQAIDDAGTAPDRSIDDAGTTRFARPAAIDDADSAPDRAIDDAGTTRFARPAAIDDAGTGRVTRASARSSRTEMSEIDDGWGPPGTTIPPPYLGALPDTYEEPDPSAGSIPIATSAEVSAASVVEDDPAAALEASSAAVIDSVRELDRATSRDEIVASMTVHLAATCQAAGFFALRDGTLWRWQSGASTAEISLAVADTPFGDVVTSARPHRGPLTAGRATAFVRGALGVDPFDVVAFPVVVRNRVVGLLVGANPAQPVFYEHILVVVRAAGLALERVLRDRAARRRS